jgi:hypothetical protein
MKMLLPPAIRLVCIEALLCYDCFNTPLKQAVFDRTFSVQYFLYTGKFSKI